MSTKLHNAGTRWASRTVAVLLLLVAAAASTVHAATEFKSNMELDLIVLGGAIENKFGFATSFPKPDPATAPPQGNLNNNPGGKTDAFTQNGGTAAVGIRFNRKNTPGGRGLDLGVSGITDAVPANGSLGQAEGWASGSAMFRLGNFTGRPGLPAAEDVPVNLSLTLTREMLASATNDLLITDRANAKLVYSVINLDTGAELVPQREIVLNDDDAEAAKIRGKATVGIPIPAFDIPADTFWNIELFGHVYGAGESKGTAPPPAPNTGIPGLQGRMNATLPDPQMWQIPAQYALFGDALAHGDWALASLAGVTGEDPQAVHGQNTVMVHQVATSGNGFHDLEIAIEAPVDGHAVMALDNVLMAAPGFHGFFHHLEMGVGVGDQFQLSPDPLLMSFGGPQTPLPPQELTGAYQLQDANDPHQPTQMLFGGEMHNGQQAHFQIMAQVHDAADGQIDGMARFTVRQFLEGFGGDYNGDFFVNGQDGQLVQQTYGANDFLADGNGDGVISGPDLLIHQRNLGQGFDVASQANLQGVPEPATLAMLLLGSSALTVARRRQS